MDIELDIVEQRAAGRIFGLRKAADLLGVSISTLKRGWPEGRFPAPIRTSIDRIGWLESEILAWQRARIADRDAELAKRKIGAPTKAA